MDYANFSIVKAQHVEYTDCALKESVFYQVKWTDWKLVRCNLARAELSDTLLKGLDATSCDPAGLRADIRGLRGLKVTPGQAAQLFALLGLDIQEPS